MDMGFVKGLPRGEYWDYLLGDTALSIFKMQKTEIGRRRLRSDSSFATLTKMNVCICEFGHF